MDLATIPAPEVDAAITLSRQQLSDEERAASPQFTSSTYNGQWMGFGPKLDVLLLTYAPVFQAVGMISGDVAMMPRDIYQWLGPKEKQLDPDHPAYRPIRFSPETGYNAHRWWRRLMVQTLIYSNGYAKIHRDGMNNLRSLELLESSRMDYERRAGRLMYRYQWSQGGWSWFNQQDILHVEDVALHQDRSWVNVMRPLWQGLQMLKTVNIGLAAEDFIVDFFANGGRTGGILTLSAGATKKTRDTVEEGFRKVYESGEAFKTMTLREDVAKFIPSQMSGNDAQLVEGREFEVADVARWYRLPPHKLGLPGSPSYNSVGEENDAYLRSTLQNYTVAIEEEVNFKILMGGRNDGPITHRCLHDTRPILRLSPKDQMEVSVKGVGGPVLTQNEGRAPLGLNPVEGGDTVAVPLNMTGLEDDTLGTDKGTSGRGGIPVPERIASQLEDAYEAAVKADEARQDALRDAIWPSLESELQIVQRQAKGCSLLEFNDKVPQWEIAAQKRIVRKLGPLSKLTDIDGPAIADRFIESLCTSLAKVVCESENTEEAVRNVCGWHSEQYKERIQCEKLDNVA